MTDARRRTLARGDDLESEARLLVEAVRAGELTQADLDLATDLGDARAGLATGRPTAPLPGLCASLAAGPRRLTAACALGELAFPAWCWPRPIAPMVGEWVGEGVTALRAARHRGTPVPRERASNAHDASTERDGALLELGALAARIVALACEAAGERPASLSSAARLAAGLLGEHEVRGGLARALLPPRLRPAPPSDPAGWWSDAEHLRRRLAAGITTRERLEIAHSLGHGPASEVLGRTPPPYDRPPASWVESLDPSSPLTREVAVRSLLAGALTTWHAAPSSPAGRTLRATAAWCRAPSVEGAAEALRASRTGPFRGEKAADHVVREVFGLDVAPLDLVRVAARACSDSSAMARDALLAWLRARDASDLGWDVSRDVIPWLLGYRDVLVELLER